MATRAGKRPMRVVSAQEKLEAIRRVHDGESKASVARDIGVPESTLRGWCKNEDKISFQSRQSSPETDESLEPQCKKSRVDDSMQPFNLSLKSNSGAFSPNSDSRYAVTDSSVKAADSEVNRVAPINLNAKQAKTEVPRTDYPTERERNRAELARMSIELGLNRPEMFLSNLHNQQNLADFSLLTWQTVMYQQIQQLHQQRLQDMSKNKVNAPADTSSHSLNFTGLLSMVDQERNKHLPKNQPPVDDVVIRWLKDQQNTMSSHQNTLQRSQRANEATTSAESLGTSSTPLTSKRMNGHTQDRTVWKFHNGNGCTQAAPPQCSPDKPILYQQLTRETAQKEASLLDQQNAENLSVGDKSTRLKETLKKAASAVPDRQRTENLSIGDESTRSKETAQKESNVVPDQQNSDNLSVGDKSTRSKEALQEEASAVPDQQNAENLSVVDKSTRSNNNNTNRVRCVLDNLLFNSMNNVAINNKKEESKDDEAVEALEHGEMFMKFLETCSYPLVTATQIMQYRTLLNNVRSGAARKSEDQQNKAKLKRK